MPTSQALLRALQERPDPNETLRLLTQLSMARLRPAELLSYHEALLFH
jgi:hypothetical protein